MAFLIQKKAQTIYIHINECGNCLTVPSGNALLALRGRQKSVAIAIENSQEEFMNHIASYCIICATLFYLANATDVLAAAAIF